MRQSQKWMVSFIAILVIAGCDKVSLKSDKSKASYTIGQQIGGNLKRQGIEVDAKALAMGISDAVEGKKGQLSQEEMQKSLAALQQEAMSKQQAVVEANAKTAKEFLEKNKSQPGVKVTKSGLQYIVEKEGTGKAPTPKDFVRCHYKGTLITGEQFDSSYDRGKPADFPVTGVIPGWTEALQMMKVGGKMKLFIPPELAYGPNGRGNIPPNSVLIFELELLDVIKQPKK